MGCSGADGAWLQLLPVVGQPLPETAGLQPHVGGLGHDEMALLSSSFLSSMGGVQLCEATHSTEEVLPEKDHLETGALSPQSH